MTKADIAHNVARVTGLTNGDAAAAVDDLLRALADALVAGQRVELRGFGTFKTVLRAPRTGWNPHTRVEVKIPSRRVPVFRPGTRLKRLGSERDDDGHVRQHGRTQ